MWKPCLTSWVTDCWCSDAWPCPLKTICLLSVQRDGEPQLGWPLRVRGPGLRYGWDFSAKNFGGVSGLFRSSMVNCLVLPPAVLRWVARNIGDFDRFGMLVLIPCLRIPIWGWTSATSPSCLSITSSTNSSTTVSASGSLAGKIAVTSNITSSIRMARRKTWPEGVAERRGRKAWLKGVVGRRGRMAWLKGVVRRRACRNRGLSQMVVNWLSSILISCELWTGSVSCGSSWLNPWIAARSFGVEVAWQRPLWCMSF